MKQRRFPRVEELEPRNTPSSVLMAKMDLPISGFLPNPTNPDEQIAIQGMIHIVERQVTDSAGGVHFRIHVNLQGVSGVGVDAFGVPTGTVYQIQAGAQTFDNINPGVTVLAEEATEHFVSQGSGDNFDLHVVEHFVFDANGVVSAAQFLPDTGSGG